MIDVFVVNFSLLVIAGSLLILAYCALTGRLTGPAGPPGPVGPTGAQGEPARPSPPEPASGAGIRTDLVRVYTGSSSGWEPHTWVEKNSSAHLRYYNSRGFAVQEHGGEIDPGNQD